jgi:hypothetical protein
MALALESIPAMSATSELAFHNVLPPDRNSGILDFGKRHTTCGALLITMIVVVADALLVYENLVKGEDDSYITHLTLGSQE